MKCKIAENFMNEIDNSIKSISSFRNISILEESYLAKFLMVFSCGLYEASIESIILEMVGRLNSTELNRYVNESMHEKFRSPNIENICRTLSMFNINWAKELRKMPNDNKSAINSIKDNKDAIAHGLSCTITLSQAIDFCNRSRPIIEKIDEMVLA